MIHMGTKDKKIENGFIVKKRDEIVKKRDEIVRYKQKQGY